MKRQPYLSRGTLDVLAVFGASVRAARLRRRWTVEELAERVGVSHPTITKVERGDPTVALGTALEAAFLVGVPLLSDDPAELERYGASKRAELALLPEAARRHRRSVSDDF